jgi:hypothetical protein
MSRRIVEEGAPGVPIWVLSFGDMITNLLAFFILLQSFSHAQRAELLQRGEGPVTSTIADFGGGPLWLIGRRPEPEYGFKRRRYAVEADPDNLGLERIIDAEDETIRKLFDDLRRSMDTRTSDLRKGPVRVFPTAIRFPANDADLDPSAQSLLTSFAQELLQDPAAPRLDIYVIGLAADAAGRPGQFILSARRAQAAREFLQIVLPLELKAGGSRVFSWGIGSGLEGPGALAAANPPHIVIAVIESQAEE